MNLPETIILATRKSPLALAQAELVASHLRKALPGHACELLRMVTTGDRQAEWSLEKQGGKGLFTGELERALLVGEAHLAVHSCKDLPSEMAAGLALAGFLPREIPNDVLVVREGVTSPRRIATGSPRRRQQLQRRFPQADFSEIRGNVDTRLRKIAEGQADATVLAAAGLRRLGLQAVPGVRFEVLPIDVSVPAVGQAAIAVQCRSDHVPALEALFDGATAQAVILERAFLSQMGGGCHVAFAAHVADGFVHLFHDSCGYRKQAVTADDFARPGEAAARILRELSIHD